MRGDRAGEEGEVGWEQGEEKRRRWELVGGRRKEDGGSRADFRGEESTCGEQEIGWVVVENKKEGGIDEEVEVCSSGEEARGEKGINPRAHTLYQ